MEHSWICAFTIHPLYTTQNEKALCAEVEIIGKPLCKFSSYCEESECTLKRDMGSILISFLVVCLKFLWRTLRSSTSPCFL